MGPPEHPVGPTDRLLQVGAHGGAVQEDHQPEGLEVEVEMKVDLEVRVTMVTKVKVF